jgi:hypothetical protein
LTLFCTVKEGFPKEMEAGSMLQPQQKDGWLER